MTSIKGKGFIHQGSGLKGRECDLPAEYIGVI